jgi:hypothetical protein
VNESSGKGRPTPKRKESQAARKQQLKASVDRKAARKLMRSQQRETAAKMRQGLKDNDEKYFPPRDQGPIRSFVRDTVDSRWSAGEIFLPFAILVLAASLVPVLAVQQLIYLVWLFMMVFLATDLIAMIFRVRRRVAAQFGKTPETRRIGWYAVSRALQMRRMRLPAPKVRIGGKSIEKKAGN